MEPTQTPKARIIAFDFDGVIAHYEGFKGGEIAGEPIEEVSQTIKILKDKGYKILVHSTRGDEFLKEYCTMHEIPFDYINHRPDREGENPGKPIAYVYVDDRALCYHGQKADELVSQIENFKAHWEK